MGAFDPPGVTRGVGDLRWSRAQAAVRAGNIFNGLRPCATRTRFIQAASSAAASQSNGVRVIASYQTKHYFPDDAYGVRIVFGNSAWWNTLATNYTITVTCDIKFGGNLYRMTFDGSNSAVIDPLGYRMTSPIGPMIPAGTTLQIDHAVSVATSGNLWPAAVLCSTGEGVVNDSDQTMVASPPWNGTLQQQMSVPAAIVGYVPNPSYPTWLFAGDSILQGQGDSAQQQPYDAGWGCKSLANRAAYIQASLYGDSATSAVPYGRDRAKAIGTCDYVISAMGSNDLYVNSRTVAQVQADNLALWKAYAGRGSRVVIPTIPPRTTSTDNWTTTGNQTISNSGVNTSRTTYNDWVRDGAPFNTATGLAVATGTSGATIVRIGSLLHPVFAYIDLADVAETSRNSGIWKVGASRTVTDAAMTSGSAVLTSATAAFTSLGDVGGDTFARVSGAGAAGAALMSLIASYTSATSVGLTATASTTVSGATAVIVKPPTTDGVHFSPWMTAQVAAAANLASSTYPLY